MKLTTFTLNGKKFFIGSAIPADGKAGQVLSQNENGKLEWIDPPPKTQLLINPNFRNPINQRGITGTFEQEGQYFLDMWKLIDGTATIEEDGLLLNGTIVQPLEFPIGQDTTASVLTTDGVMDAGYDDDEKVFTITASNKNLITAKLETGKYSTVARKEAQTWVANDPPLNYQQELMKCQRYYRTYGAGITALVKNNYQLLVVLPFENNMRARPTITFLGSSDPIIWINGSSNYSCVNTFISGFDVSDHGIMFAVFEGTYSPSPPVGAVVRYNSSKLLFAADANL